jgi:hypothetical protein
MEKLNSDMLEMILTQPTKRLNERQTKFLIYQVIKYSFLLKYLLLFLNNLGSCCFEIFA